MFYKYNKEKLLFESCYRDLVKILIICSTLSIVIFGAGYITGNLNTSVIELEGGVHVIKEETTPFSKEALVKMIDELGMKHPHIVLAQSILETGHWTSVVFKQNNNLFGMRLAGSRVKTAQRAELNHAYYNTWQESVYDYAFFQCLYLSKLDTEEQYFAGLDASYAEVGNSYSVALRKIIETEKLKELFDEK